MYEAESKDYKACRFELNGKKIISRYSKITPKKVGQFVTCWKRDSKNETTPFEDSDVFDFLVVSVFTETKKGQFIFPKSALLKHKIISSQTSNGKRGFRVYAPWELITNKQAKKTQLWQSAFFVNFTETTATNKLKKLFQE